MKSHRMLAQCPFAVTLAGAFNPAQSINRERRSTRETSIRPDFRLFRLFRD